MCTFVGSQVTEKGWISEKTTGGRLGEDED